MQQINTRSLLFMWELGVRFIFLLSLEAAFKALDVRLDTGWIGFNAVLFGSLFVWKEKLLDRAREGTDVRLMALTLC
jgi:hypothetical protein